jgi:hypothetical protein
MNSILESYYPVFKLYQSLRKQMMDMLEDGDLAFRPADGCPRLGTLCREIGEVEYSYIQSFRTFELDFSYRVNKAGFEESVDQLKAWYQDLDQELESVVASISQQDIDNRKIDRGGGFLLSPEIQLDVYKEALLIFYGKSSVYLKALQKQLPKQWDDWIG